MKLLIGLTLLTLTLACGQSVKQNQPIETRCEDCDLMLQGMPAHIGASANLAPAQELGEKLIITGTIYKPDGKTPAPDVLLYVYHTDANGYYSPGANQKYGKRHGHLRGRMKTGADGKYSFTTIRPASYPSRKDPQHIHPIIKEPNTSLYWIDEYLFDDDPLLTEKEKQRQEKRGGSGIIHLTKNNAGVWIGERNIVLGLNVPNYP